MSLLVWVMMGIAVWHFTVFVPDRFWGGIVGAFVAAFLAAAIFGFIVNGATVPGRNDTELIQALGEQVEGPRAWKLHGHARRHRIHQREPARVKP